MIYNDRRPEGLQITFNPPYNTGARDWKYNNDYVDGNDQYRHSKWLSMMKKRLILAKKLMNPKDSVLIVTIDEKEYLHLGCLLEELFSDANIQMISSVVAQKGVARNNSFYRVNEYIFFMQLGGLSVIPLPLSDSWVLGNKDSAAAKGIVWSQLRRSGTTDLRIDRPNLFYPLIFDEEGEQLLEVCYPLPMNIHPQKSLENKEGKLYLWPLKANGIEGRWQISRDEVLERLRHGYIKIGKKKDDTIPNVIKLRFFDIKTTLQKFSENF